MVEILATKSEEKVTVTINDMLALFCQFFSKNNGIGRKLRWTKKGDLVELLL